MKAVIHRSAATNIEKINCSRNEYVDTRGIDNRNLGKTAFRFTAVARSKTYHEMTEHCVFAHLASSVKVSRCKMNLKV